MQLTVIFWYEYWLITDMILSSRFGLDVEVDVEVEMWPSDLAYI